MGLFEIAALLLIAGFVIAMHLTRDLRTRSDGSAHYGRKDGFRFFLAWFLAGGSVALVTWVLMAIAGMGGVWTPPDTWATFHLLGLVVLPFLLILGGVPAASRISRGLAWKKTAAISLAVCVASWLVIVGVVFFGPSIFGWSW